MVIDHSEAATLALASAAIRPPQLPKAAGPWYDITGLGVASQKQLQSAVSIVLQVPRQKRGERRRLDELHPTIIRYLRMNEERSRRSRYTGRVPLNHSAATRAARALLVAGVLMLLPGACTLVRSAPTRDDAGVAFTEVTRIRLDSFKPESPIRLVFRVPDSAQWKRLRDAWGDHGFIVYAARKEGSTPWIIPFSTLNLDVTVSHAGRSLVVERSSGCPYLISSETEDCAVAFKPSPGDELEVTLTSRGTGNPPAGDFVIQPYWGGYEKDRIVGAMIDSDLKPYILGTAAIGMVLLIASAILGIASAQRVRRS